MNNACLFILLTLYFPLRDLRVQILIFLQVQFYQWVIAFHLKVGQFCPWMFDTVYPLIQVSFWNLEFQHLFQKLKFDSHLILIQALKSKPSFLQYFYPKLLKLNPSDLFMNSNPQYSFQTLHSISQASIYLVPSL